MQDTTFVRTFAEKSIWAGAGNICTNGYVGIGTSSPSVPLHVNSSANYADGNDVYFYNGSTSLFTGTGPNQPTSMVTSSRIVVFGAICAASDRRIKTNVAKRTPHDDLRLTQKIQVVNFEYIDKLTQGTGDRVGVIAQDIESVFPESVSKSQGGVPNVYKKMACNITDKDELVIYWTASALPVLGARLRLMFGATRILSTVISSDKECVVVQLNDRNDFEITGEYVFVWGEEVEDVRVVNYDSLACLSLSAIQALMTDVEELRRDNLQLHAAIENLQSQ